MFRSVLSLFGCVFTVLLVAQKPTLRYQISPIFSAKKELRLQVKMTFPADADGETTLIAPPDFGGADHLFRSIKNIQLLEKTGRFEWSADSTKIIVRHRPEGTVGLVYEVVQDWAGDDVESKNGFRPILQPTFFHILGDALFLIPMKPEAFAVQLEWLDFPANWLIHNSFGSQEKMQAFEIKAQKLRESIFVGGDFRILRTTVADQPIYVAVRGKWTFADESLVETIRQTVETQRSFWADFSIPYFTVMLIPLREHDVKPSYKPAELDLEYLGTGLTNSFAAYATNNPTVGIEHLHHLFHHELMHDWIGGKIQNGGSDPNDMTFAWFSEGFTEYLAYKNELTAGIINQEDFVFTINEEFFQKLWQSPVAEAPNSTIKTQFFTDKNVEQLPYLRGFVFAFWLDCAIQSHSKGSQSLHDFMLILLKNYGSGGLSLSEDFPFFLEKATKMSGKNVSSFYQKHIAEGSLIRIGEFVMPPYFSLSAQADEVPILEAKGEAWVKQFLK